MLLEAGASPSPQNEHGWVPLFNRVWAPKRELFDLLYFRAPGDVNYRDYKGCTPLHCAAAARKLEAVKILLSKGADPTIRNKRWKKPRGYMDLAKDRSAERKAIDIEIIRRLKDVEGNH